MSRANPVSASVSVSGGVGVGGGMARAEMVWGEVMADPRFLMLAVVGFDQWVDKVETLS